MPCGISKSAVSRCMMVLFAIAVALAFSTENAIAQENAIEASANPDITTNIEGTVGAAEQAAPNAERISRTDANHDDSDVACDAGSAIRKPSSTMGASPEKPTKAESISSAVAETKPSDSATRPSSDAASAEADEAAEPAKAKRTAGAEAVSSGKAPSESVSRQPSASPCSVAVEPKAPTSTPKPSAQAASDNPKATRLGTQSTASSATNSTNSTIQAQDSPGGATAAAQPTYYLSSVVKRTQVATVANASAKAGAGVVSHDVTAATAQRWQFKRLPSGLVIIANEGSGKVLAVAGAKAVEGAKVVQWDYKRDNALSQRWTLKQSNGLFTIYSALGKNLVLDIEGGSAANGARLIIWGNHNTANQRFRLYSTATKPATPGSKTVQDGIYQLCSPSNSNRVVDIAGGSLKLGANAISWDSKGDANQAFSIDYDGKGYYTLTNVKSGKLLAVSAECGIPGVNVSQDFLSTAGNRAKWAIEKSDARYRFLNKATGMALSLEGTKFANGTNINTWTPNANSAQRFTLKSQPALPLGPIQISVPASSDLVLDVRNGSLKADATIGTYKSQSTMNQRFLLSKTNAGYTVRPFNSRLYLTATEDGRVVQDSAHKGLARQIWRPSAKKGLITLVHAATGKALSLGATPDKAAGALMLAKITADKTQQLYLKSTDAFTTGVYTITASSNTSEVIDVQNARRTSGANVQLWASSGCNNQKFEIVATGVDTYRIANVSSGRVIGTASSSASSGSNVEMQSDRGSASQRWAVVFNDDFSYSFKNKKSGLLLNMTSSTPANGVNVTVYSSTATKQQEFWIQHTSRDTTEIVSIGVPCYMQNPELPTGCESVALTNALRYWNFNLGKTTIADYWMPYGDDGVYDFIGDPHDESGWIICAPGITNTANEYLQSKGSSLNATNVTGTSLGNLRTYLDKGLPVIVWTTIDMGSPSDYVVYRHGYPLRYNNHAVVLTGYDPNDGSYLVADSLAGTVWRSGSAFASLYEEMGSQAVVIGD